MSERDKIQWCPSELIDGLRFGMFSADEKAALDGDTWWKLERLIERSFQQGYQDGYVRGYGAGWESKRRETKQEEVPQVIPISEAACATHGPHSGTVDCPEC